MPVTQVLTITKPGASFETIGDLFEDLNSIVDSDYFTYIQTALIEGTIINSVSFTENSNTATLTRTWDDAKYEDFQTNWAAVREANGNAVTSAGWILSGDSI